jgi:hypothetical protein
LSFDPKLANCSSDLFSAKPCYLEEETAANQASQHKAIHFICQQKIRFIK